MFFYRLNLTESCFPKNQNLGIPLDSTSQSPCSTGPCATRRVCTRGSQKGSSQTHSEGGGAPFFRRELAVSQLSGVSCRCGGNWGKTNQIFLSEMDLCWWLTMIVGFSRKVFFFLCVSRLWEDSMMHASSKMWQRDMTSPNYGLVFLENPSEYFGDFEGHKL